MEKNDRRLTVKAIATIPMISLLFLGCVFLPKASVKENRFTECKMSTPKWELSHKEFTDFSGCYGSAEETGVCLAVIGIIIPAGSLIVSGSIVLVGNTVHWLEYQGRCDDGAIQSGLATLRGNFGNQIAE
jgi:hypothetical protein